MDVFIGNLDIISASKYNSSLFLRDSFHIDLLIHHELAGTSRVIDSIYSIPLCTHPLINQVE